MISRTTARNALSTIVYVFSVLAALAVHAQNSVTLTMAVNDASWGTTLPAPGQHEVTAGEAVQISAVPNNGYQFSKWNAGNNATVADENIADTSVILTKNATVTAIFTASSGTTVELTMAVNDPAWGSTNPAVGTHTVDANQPVQITATPSAGYDFSKWTGGTNVVIADENSASTTATLSKNATVTAVFAVEPKEVQFIISVSPAGAGTTNPGEGTYTYEAGDSFAINANSASGYEFYCWSVNGGVSVKDATSASTTATIIDNGSATAVFVPTAFVDLQIGLVNVKTTNSAVNKDTIVLNKGVIPEGFPALSADSVVTVVVGGYATDCTNFAIDTEKGKYVSKFAKADGTKIDLRFDTLKKSWSFKATAADAFDSLIFNFDPVSMKTEILVYMSVDGVNYGRTYDTDENTTWKWKADENLSEKFFIEKSSGNFKTNTNIDPAAKKDKFGVPKATLTGLTPVKSMFSNAAVTIRIDSLTYDTGITLLQPNPDKEVYKASVDTGAGLVKIILKQDENHYVLNLNISKADCSGIKGPDINVRITLGDVYNGNMKISTSQKTTLKYKVP